MHNGEFMNNAIVTLVIQHHILPGAAAAYEAWLKEIIPVAQGFAGHLGVNVLRPAAQSNTYTVVIRFDNHEHLRQWVDSDARTGLISRVQPLLAKDEEIEITTGLEYWFTPPGGEQKRARPFRQFLVTLSAIFPLTVVVPWLLAPVLRSVHPLAGTFLVALIVVFLMIYVIMPRYTKLIARWLFA
jgi:antibiotic biosynthesis monooxygenase (ABM) superfamily enzyme